MNKKNSILLLTSLFPTKNYWILTDFKDIWGDDFGASWDCIQKFQDGFRTTGL